MSLQANQHNQLIIEQFTQQAAPFLALSEHSEENAMRILLDELQLTDTESVLDVACGPGLVGCAIAPHALSVYGVDLTPGMIEQAEKLQGEKGLTNLSWQIADVMALPFPDGTFSRVVTRYTFHHFLEPQAVLKEMIRVCQPGGRIVVVDAFTGESPEQADRYNAMEKLRDPSHVRALKRSELLSMMGTPELTAVNVQAYRLHMPVEKILASSFPEVGGREQLRTLFEEDLGINSSGFEPYLDAEQKLRFSFPILVLSAEKHS